VAVIQIQRGLWIEAIGLFFLGFGLVALKIAVTRPAWKRAAWLSFGATAMSILVALLRR
jgi:uncharacterized membrane protein YcjF (UPF0283 family)